jgi:hypothetical protein
VSVAVNEADRKRAQRNVMLALAHVVLVVVVLAGFVYAQMHR